MADEKILNDNDIGFKCLYHHREKNPEVIRGLFTILCYANPNILGGGKEERVKRFKEALSHIEVTNSGEMLMITHEESVYDRDYIHITRIEPHFKKSKNVIIDYVDITYACKDKYDAAKVSLVPRWIGVEDTDPEYWDDDSIDVKIFCGFDLRVTFDEEECE